MHILHKKDASRQHPATSGTLSKNTDEYAHLPPDWEIQCYRCFVMRCGPRAGQNPGRKIGTMLNGQGMSHGLCEACNEIIYGDLWRRAVAAREEAPRDLH